MNKLTSFMKRAVGISLTVLFIFVNIFADPATMDIDGIDYVNTGAKSVTFGANIWHTRELQSNLTLPFREVFTVDVGQSYSSPVINNGYIFLLAGNHLKAVSISEKKVVDSVKVQDGEASRSQITYIRNSSGWYNPDKNDRLIFGTRDGKLYSFYFDFSTKKLNMDWVFGEASGYRYTSTPSIVFDSGIMGKSYICIGSTNKKFYIIQPDNGKKVEEITEAGEITSSPLVYKFAEGGIFNTFLYGVDAGFGGYGGYLSAGYFWNGNFVQTWQFNKENTNKLSIAGIPASMTSHQAIIDGITVQLIFLSDKEGRMYCFEKNSGKLLWQIDKYKMDGQLVINNTPSVDDTYVYFTYTNFNRSGKAKLVAVDYRKAAAIASQKNNPKHADIAQAIEIETADTSYGDVTYSGSTIINVLERLDSESILVRSKLIVTSDIGADPKKDNLFVYYADKKYDNGTFKPVPAAFMEQKVVDNELRYYTRPSLHLPGGVISEPIFTDGYLLVVDGQGKLHGYTSAFEKNLAIFNMANHAEIKQGSTTEPVKENIVQKGKTYTVVADIVNFYNSDLVTDIEYTINPDSHNSKTLLQDQIISPEGVASYFTYTVPESYNEPYITIKCEVNPKRADGLRKIEDESIYEDNVQIIKIPVDQGQVDLEARNLRSEDPALANAWQISTVDILNNTEKQMNSVLVHYKVNGSIVKEERLNLPPKGTVGRTFQWKAPDYNTNAILSVIVDPYREKENGNHRANNTATKTVQVVKATSPNTGTCPGNKTSGSWQETYNLITGYPTYTEHYIDNDGNEKTRRWTDYNDPIWETRTVTYHETLTYSVEINTKQQYEDSRGGWEIIPYAQKRNIPANKVTRSGYGIEITVTTSYSNDWESKVPKGLEGTAYPKGGIFSGAQRVTAYLPNGQTVEMVPDKTPGPGVYNITWRLPEVSYTPPGTSEVWKGRYFSMDPRTPDGEYPFTIVIRGAGHEQLRCTAEEKIYIYGDVWRDINIKSNSR